MLHNPFMLRHYTKPMTTSSRGKQILKPLDETIESHPSLQTAERFSRRRNAMMTVALIRAVL